MNRTNNNGHHSSQTVASSLRLFGVVDGHFDFDTRLDVDGGDLLDHVGRRVQVDQALVDAHFELVVGVGTCGSRRRVFASKE